MDIIVASMVKNEAGRYWRSALAAWSEFADRIVVLDDGSTDDTVAIAESFDKTDVFSLPDAQDAWGHEAPHRSALFSYAMSAAEPGDVIFWLDADMVPGRDPRTFFDASEIDVWAFRLYDLWHDKPLAYRHEPPWWVASTHTRPWAIRVPAEKREYRWQKDKIHSGHIPVGWWDTLHEGIALPPAWGLMHYGYFTEADRKQHAANYEDIEALLTSQQIAHARTILDDEPQLIRLPFTPQWPLERAT